MPFDTQEKIEFDEGWYLEKYPDIAKAVQDGQTQSGFAHYLSHGIAEGRFRSAQDEAHANPLHTVVSLADYAQSCAELIPSFPYAAPNCLIYSNAEMHDKAFGIHMRYEVLQSRTCRVAPICLYELPPRTTIYGGDKFQTGNDDVLVAEQILISDDIKSAKRDRELIEINAPTMLACRWGIPTWGHWMGDLLPKIVVAEHYFPGRFSIALPDWVLAADRWMESLSAYNIERDRITPLSPDTNYVFSELCAISPIRSNAMVHPGVADLMTRLVQPIRGIEAGHRIALMRTDAPNRRVSNFDEVISALKAKNYEIRETAHMTFMEQVSLFRRARTIAGVLGSGLSGLLYSSPGIGVISFAPPSWGDSFFYSLIQIKAGRYADIRGPITRLDPMEPIRDSDFHVNIDDLRTALAII